MDPSSPNEKVDVPEVEAETKTTKYFHLYNCDKTYKLDAVEKLLKSIGEKLRFDISIAQHYFHLREMSGIIDMINSEPQMDFAIFVVHAHESHLSINLINEDNAGIGYAKIYRALLQKTGEKVIIVIGGDDNYRNSTKEQTAVLSRWAYRKVSSQFDEQFLNGRKSFIFSWDKEHRPIHEEAMFHFFDPCKKGKTFVPEPKDEPTVPGVDPQKGVESRENSKTNAHETSNVMEEKQTSEGQEPETSSEQRMDYHGDPKQMDETAADNPDPQRGVESHKSSKTNADETSNVIKEKQTCKSQKNETSSEQRMDYQRDPNQMDETAADNSESVGLSQEQQKTEEDDYYESVSVDDVPKEDNLTDAQVSLMHANTVILYRDQSDIAYTRNMFGDELLDKGGVKIKNASDLKEFFSSNSVESCFMFVEAKTMQEELQKRSQSTPYEDLFRTVREKVEEKVVIFLCYNKFSQVDADAITVRIKERFVNKNVNILWKQNEGTSRPTVTRSWPCPSPQGQFAKKGPGSSQGVPAINPEDLTLLLKTRLRHGKISYDAKDVEERKEGWTAPQTMAEQLLVRWQSTINAELRISKTTKTGDHHIVVKDQEISPMIRMFKGVL